jgi:hypothetical protein
MTEINYEYKYLKYIKKINKLKNEIKLLKENKINKDKYIKNISHNKFIYKNTKDIDFIDKLSLKENNIEGSDFKYYTLGNDDNMLKKFKNNKKYFDENKIIKVLDYNKDSLLFEINKK